MGRRDADEHEVADEAAARVKRVTLSDAQVERADAVANARQSRSSARRSRNQHGFDSGRRSEAAIHIQGARGELAVAIALGQPWQGSVDTFKQGGDVGPLQVRCRSHPDWDLLVRTDDPDEAIYVLVTGTDRVYNVVGWIRGRDAKRPEWIRSHGGREAAWFVPQSALTPIGDVFVGTLRSCPSCGSEHPVGTTCSDGWSPWESA